MCVVIISIIDSREVCPGVPNGDVGQQINRECNFHVPPFSDVGVRSPLVKVILSEYGRAYCLVTGTFAWCTKKRLDANSRGMVTMDAMRILP